MTHLIKLAAGKLNDPILMDWALDRYRQASKGQNHRQEELEQAWFDELTLRRWLNNDDQETLNRLFVHLPEKQFANLAKAIGERWNDWSGSLAYHRHRMFSCRWSYKNTLSQCRQITNPDGLYKQRLKDRNRTLSGSLEFSLKGQERTVLGRSGAGGRSEENDLFCFKTFPVQAVAGSH